VTFAPRLLSRLRIDAPVYTGQDQGCRAISADRAARCRPALFAVGRTYRARCADRPSSRSVVEGVDCPGRSRRWSRREGRLTCPAGSRRRRVRGTERLVRVGQSGYSACGAISGSATPGLAAVTRPGVILGRPNQACAHGIQHDGALAGEEVAVGLDDRRAKGPFEERPGATLCWCRSPRWPPFRSG
jgi:hypothetical protein